jgi:hypothetical protein
MLSVRQDPSYGRTATQSAVSTSSLAAALLDSLLSILTFAPYGKFQPYFRHQPSLSAAYYITMPPPAWIFCPVNHRASSLTMNATTSAISLGSPSRFNGDSWMPI